MRSVDAYRPNNPRSAASPDMAYAAPTHCGRSSKIEAVSIAHVANDGRLPADHQEPPLDEVQTCNPWLSETLRTRVGASVDPARVADVLIGILREIEATLGPTLGTHGVLLLIRRGFYLTPSLRPLLASTPTGAQLDADSHFDALREMLLNQTIADALTVGTVLLQTFYDLIVTLVGLPLTERLLRSVWASYSSGMPAPES
ncbi:MAG: hypothetical protein ACOH1P_05615 [Lysobacter sp.]